MKQKAKHRFPIYYVVWVAFASILLASALGFWVLISPDNPLTSWYRSAMVGLDARVVIGPYPVERDFKILKRHHIEILVSLLDPLLPHEAVLLEREKAMARQYGMKFLHFPMTSLFGQKLRNKQYDANAALAAEAVVQEPGKVYVHCYLGLHRAKVVAKLIEAKSVPTMPYLVREGERASHLRILDRAQADYDAKRYKEAVAGLRQLKELNFSAQLLMAWACYHAGEGEESYRHFTALLQDHPKYKDAITGAGYAALRLGKLPEAEGHFMGLLHEDPQHGDALYGMGLLRLRQERYEEARTYLETVIRLYPTNYEAKGMMGKLPASLRRKPAGNAKPPVPSPSGKKTLSTP